MLSPEYQAILREHHTAQAAKRPKGWGTTGARNFGRYVLDMLNSDLNLRSVLDFGCGQGSLGRFIRENAQNPKLDWTDYDPGIAEKAISLGDRRFDVVVTSDMFEHVEPEFVLETMAEVSNLTARYQYHWIACEPANGELPDGRNAHLTVREPDWWAEKFSRSSDFMVMEWSSHVQRKRSQYKTAARVLLERVR
jgi:cyclopropane fatty-acyl-phospholipid synthase-like methyltransferase